MIKPKSLANKPENICFDLPHCFAKTFRTADSATAFGRTVEDHCLIASAVAREIMERINQTMNFQLPEYAFLPALLHDLGKISPYFQFKLYKAVHGEDTALQMKEFALIKPSNDERLWGGHAGVGYSELLQIERTKGFAKIVGEHHGLPSPVNKPEKESFGGMVWQGCRKQLLEKLLPKTPAWQDVSPETGRAISGLTVVADWIASGQIFEDPKTKDWQSLVKKAVDEASFIWPEYYNGLSFADVFGFEPRQVQKSFYEAVTGPGVYILEAPMGIGKTEAALYAAYKMLETGQASGLYFALPTRLTSNKIHERVNRFLDKVLTDSASAKLLHGQAWLERYQEQHLGKDGDVGGSWFDIGKRGILAPFGVGTLDQALLAAMNVRHGMLRTFGLLGKVVIIDECHTYDAYTGSILDGLVSQLASLGCTVIILSATLTMARKKALLQACGLPEGENCDFESKGYPLITAIQKDQKVKIHDCEQPPAKDYLIGHPENDELAIEAALARAEAGQRVLWIENTVADAQVAYRTLCGRAAGIDDLRVGLLHSRFTPPDRARIEGEWTSFFAWDAPGRGKQGGILVGTQVVEQSLDLDADFLLTRICPTDMLLQRLGRLWRHETTARTADAKCEAWILHPNMDAVLIDPKSAFARTDAVYSQYILYRSLEIWQQICKVKLPDEIRELIENTYHDRIENNGKMEKLFRDLKKQIADFHTLAMRAQSANMGIMDDSQNDENMPTRLNEIPTTDLLLCKSINWQNKKLIFIDGTSINFSAPRLYRKDKIAIAARITMNTARVPARITSDLKEPQGLEKFVYCKNLRIALVAGGGRLQNESKIATSVATRYLPDMGIVEDSTI